MIVSVRSPATRWPYLAFLPSRWSEPTISTFIAVPATLAGRVAPRSPAVTSSCLTLPVSLTTTPTTAPAISSTTVTPIAISHRSQGLRRAWRVLGGDWGASTQPAAHVTPKGDRADGPLPMAETSAVQLSAGWTCECTKPDV